MRVVEDVWRCRWGAFACADHVVRGRYALPRLVAAPIETRGCVVAHEPDADLLTVWCSAQDPAPASSPSSPML